ncbi:MAG TPA: putative Ig domain-containing protein [Tepidisphaeraceae bacterium]|nr:putative Ig domain-containing protein [Tepidisphaeraceae bacterium]
MKRSRCTVLVCSMALSAMPVLPALAQSGEILTPTPPATPRINGARVYGQRPGRPFQFTIPATGQDPITYTAEGLPAGLSLDSGTGRITGSVEKPGEFTVTLTATNTSGKDSKPLVIKIGDEIGLTPPMGWNSWNCFAEAVDQPKVQAAADSFAKLGLIKHGWTYINIDDTWQGARGGKYKGLQANEKFPDMKGLCDHIHSLGLKAGIYSTPWVQSYAGFAGGSSDDPDGAWTKFEKSANWKYDGKYFFADADAKQWSDWGFDYLKYDWNPRSTKVTNEQFHTESETMYNALLHSATRDIIYSYSNSMPFDQIEDQSKMFNCWRTTGDIRDNWASMSKIGFGQDKWADASRPGHWNDPDMLVVGHVGWGPKLHPTNLTPDEQYTHITLWSLCAAPLLIGCDLTQVDDFTVSLLTNDEVLAVDQDPLGKQARRVAGDAKTGTEIWARPLSDGTIAVGLFNRGRNEIIPPQRAKKGEAAPKPVWKLMDHQTEQAEEFASEAEAREALKPLAKPSEVTVNWSDVKLSGAQPVRDIWRQKDLDNADGKFTATVPFHGAVMVKIGKPQ